MFSRGPAATFTLAFGLAVLVAVGPVLHDCYHAFIKTPS